VEEKLMARWAPLTARFAARCVPEPNTGCILWLAAGTVDGYGTICVEGRSQRAHRVAWTLANGTIPAGALVLHHCDVPGCVNVAHLFLGDVAANVADKIAKGRGDIETARAASAAKRRNLAHCKHGHLFDAVNTYRTRDGRRACRRCCKESNARSYLRRKNAQPDL
jgi:hypothetical protein